jgi:3-hydroxybutyryl-CoA dehydrogenase
MQTWKVQNIAIIGAGLMGFGIGVEYARFGYNVSFYNTKKASSEEAMQRAKEALDLMVKTRLITRATANAAYGRIIPTTDVALAVKEADMVVESAVEDLALKQDIFARLDTLCPPRVILATDTSGLSVTAIASKAKNQERILATHYTQPPHFAPMVEVCPGNKTDPKLVPFVADILRKMRKKVIVIPRDSPRFIQNRIQGVIAQECQKLVDEGLGTPEVVDNVITYGFGRRMGFTGYFKRVDLVGLKARGPETWKPVRDHVAKGETGMEAGRGFYDWPEDKKAAFLTWYHTELIRLMKQDMERGDI